MTIQQDCNGYTVTLTSEIKTVKLADNDTVPRIPGKSLSELGRVGQSRSGLVWSGLVWSGPVWSGLVWRVRHAC